MAKQTNKRKTLIIIISVILSLGVASGIIASYIPNEKPDKSDKPTIDKPIETPPEPDVEEPIVIEPQKISLTKDNVAYTSLTGATDYSGKLNIVAANEVENRPEEVSEDNLVKIVWNSGAIVSLGIDLDDYDLSDVTHLTFWFGSDPVIYSEGYAKFVQTPNNTVFSSSKYFVSSDRSVVDASATKPGTTTEDFLNCGSWKKYEIPISDVLEFYETNGKITLFHFMSQGLTINNLYLADVQFEMLAD